MNCTGNKIWNSATCTGNTNLISILCVKIGPCFAASNASVNLITVLCINIGHNLYNASNNIEKTKTEIQPAHLQGDLWGVSCNLLSIRWVWTWVFSIYKLLCPIMGSNWASIPSAILLDIQSGNDTKMNGQTQSISCPQSVLTLTENCQIQKTSCWVDAL